jgi:putative endopeptidase
MRKLRLAFAAALLLGTAASPVLAQHGAGHAAQSAKPRYGDFGLDLSAMDRSVKPGDSFWHYVNGAWDKKTEIAADRTSAGAGVLLVDEAERQVRAIVEDLARDPAKSGKIG